MRSLRMRLILLLGIAIFAVAVLQFFVAMQTSAREADKLFDYHMERMALALKDRSFKHSKLQVPSDAVANSFEFVIQIWEADGSPVEIYQSRVHAMLPEMAADGYSTVRMENGSWRIYSQHTESRVIQISQKVKARRDRAMMIAWRSVWPIIPASLLLFGAAWLVITSALSPLSRIGRDLANRNVDSLAPIAEDRLPREVALLTAELNSLLARMEQALLSQQRFVADAAHELRSPVTALSLQLQTLARARDEETRDQAVERLRGGIERASRLIEQLLVLARQDPLLQTDEIIAVSLTACIEAAIADVRVFALSRSIDIRCGALVEADIRGDEEALRILVRNLLDNAVRYTPEQGIVQIDLALEGRMLALTIQDSGGGISQDNRPRVFDRFYRVPGTKTRGTGLGLAIVKAVADRHRASVRLFQAALGGLGVKVGFSDFSLSDFSKIANMSK
ncbi:two-component sensor histidine kinase [Oxalobacteraceae bacterium CAVE-383]|nr:two-component sensor histidine kinase [Oxalobacteraceae bacterium CAVE-383]